MLTDLERHQVLVAWNGTAREYPRDTCIHQLFQEQAACTPDAVALVESQRRVTYRELHLAFQ